MVETQQVYKKRPHLSCTEYKDFHVVPFLSLFIHHIDLLAHAFLMNGFKDCFHELRRHTAEHTLRPALVEDFSITSCLNDSHLMLTLESPYLIYLAAQHLEAFSALRKIADNQLLKYKVEHIGRHLLAGIAPSGIGSAVAFYHQTVEAQIHGLLAGRRHRPYGCAIR